MGVVRVDKKIEMLNNIKNKYAKENASLKAKIEELQIECDNKDAIINSIDSYRNDLKKAIDDFKKKSEEYDRLNSDLMQMRKVFNEEVFKGRWNLIKLLMK